jgi:hypothetical protein
MTAEERRKKDRAVMTAQMPGFEVPHWSTRSNAFTLAGRRNGMAMCASVFYHCRRARKWWC